MFEVRDLNFQYDTSDFRLRNINFNVKPGEILGITGLSSSGKSTITKIISGIIPEFEKGSLSGTVHHKSNDLLELPVHLRSHHLCLIFQDPENQFFFTSLEDEIRFSLENRDFPESEIEMRIRNSLEETGLIEFKKNSPSRLSYGQQKLALFSILLANDPDIIILDEIYSSLDPETSARLKSALERLKARGKIIICIDKNLEELKNTDKILFLNNGEPEYYGSSDDFYKVFFQKYSEIVNLTE